MNLYYRRYGKGPSMIILHGLYGASDNWHSIAKTLSKDFDVILPDLRNHGKSPHSLYMNYELMQNDIYELLENLNIKQTIMIGHSMGGKTAVFFAKEHPEMLSHLIVVDISPFSYLNIEKGNKHLEIHKKIINAMLSLQPNQYSSRKEIFSEISKSIKNPDIVNLLFKNINRNANNEFEWKLNVKAINESIYSLLDGLKIDDKIITGFPVLFIKGELSDYISEEDFEQIKKLFPGSDFKIIPDSGHWLHAEKPEILIKTINEFIHNN